MSEAQDDSEMTATIHRFEPTPTMSSEAIELIKKSRTEQQQGQTSSHGNKKVKWSFRRRNTKVASSTKPATKQQPLLQHVTTKAVVQDQVVVPLLPLEEKCHKLNGSPISTLTWFQGDHTTAAVWIQQRMHAILQQNPWLVGSIDKRKGRPVLVHPQRYPPNNNNDRDRLWDTEESSEDSTHRFDNLSPPTPPNFCYVLNPGKSTICRNMPIATTADSCKNYLVHTGCHHHVWKIAIVPCSEKPNQYFALIDSMSHVIGDGHTYYQIHNMLCGHSIPIKQLNATRLFDTVQQQQQALGRREYGLFDAPGMLLSIARGVIKSKVLSPLKLATAIEKRYVLLDAQKLQEAKQDAIHGKFNSEDEKGTHKVSFVSTNDVLSSWFFNACQCHFGLMVMNFRGRLEKHTEELAGNYENSIFYYRPDFASPTLIRQSLTPSSHENDSDGTVWKRAVTGDTTATPSTWKHLRHSKFGLISNWASFAQSADLPNCTDEMHIPLFVRGKHPLPHHMTVGIIFKATPNQLAMYWVGNAKTIQKLERNAGKVVAEEPIE